MLLGECELVQWFRKHLAVSDKVEYMPYDPEILPLDRLTCFRHYCVPAQSLGCHRCSACQPNPQLPAPLSLCQMAFSHCQTLLCPYAGHTRKAGELMTPSPKLLPISEWWVLADKYPNTLRHVFYEHTESGSIGLSPSYLLWKVLDKRALPVFLPFLALLLHSSTSAFWDHLSNKWPVPESLFQSLLLGEPKWRTPYRNICHVH